MGYLFGIAMATSMLWYMFWMVMSPVKDDIAPLLNWYFFTKLSLRWEVDVYGGLKAVHNWLPLLVLTALILSKVSIIYRSYLIKLSQLVYLVVIGYNLFLIVFMVYSGRKVVQLFMVTLPLYLLLHCGPLLSQLFSPHILWLPTAFCLLLYCLFCRHTSASEVRSHKCYGLCDLTAMGAIKRAVATFFLPALLCVLTYWIMETGCLPCSATPGFTIETTPIKPLLIGHRGCAFDAPENTLVAYERASLLPTVVGLETDLFISMDGVLFLHHDLHLVRTTDVRVACPSHYPYANASLLYYHNGTCPLSKLNVGASFLRSSSRRLEVSAEEESLFEGQHMPTFSQYLEVAVRKGRTVIFDVNEPPVGHPYHHNYLNRTVAEIVAAGVPPHKVWWTPVEGRQWIHQKHPDFILTTKTEDTPFENLRTEHIQKINADWSVPLATFRDYQKANMSINMFFVESVFMYSYAWCIGMETVTTSNCILLSTVDSNPFLQICRQWQRARTMSWCVFIVGISVLLLQVFMFIGWETLRVSGYSLRGATNNR